MRLLLVCLILSMVSACGSVRHNRNVQTQLTKCTERRTLLLVEVDSLCSEKEQLQRTIIKQEQEIYNLEYEVDSLRYVLEISPYKFSVKYKRGRLARRKDF